MASRRGRSMYSAAEDALDNIFVGALGCGVELVGFGQCEEAVGGLRLVAGVGLVAVELAEFVGADNDVVAEPGGSVSGG